jgi:hypothetical protein
MESKDSRAEREALKKTFAAIRKSMQKKGRKLKTSKRPMAGFIQPDGSEAGPRGVEYDMLRLNLLWDSRIGLPITSHRRVIGPLVATAKKIFRAILKPYSNSILEQQAEFNRVLLSLLGRLSKELADQRHALDEVRKRLSESSALPEPQAQEGNRGETGQKPAHDAGAKEGDISKE